MLSELMISHGQVATEQFEITIQGRKHKQNTFHLHTEIKAFFFCRELPFIKLCHLMPYNQILLYVWKDFPWHLSFPLFHLE